jgi:hypothetical protein
MKITGYGLESVALNIADNKVDVGTSLFHFAKMRNITRFKKCYCTGIDDKKEWIVKTDCGGWPGHSGSGYGDEEGRLIGVRVGSETWGIESNEDFLKDAKDIWDKATACLSKNNFLILFLLKHAVFALRFHFGDDEI